MSSTSRWWSLDPETILAPLLALAAVTGLERLAPIKSPHPSNISGNPSCSVPVGLHDGLPVGMQIMAVQHADRLVLDAASGLIGRRPVRGVGVALEHRRGRMWLRRVEY